MKLISLLAFSAFAAFPQPVQRALSFQQIQNPPDIAEAATVIRSIGEIRDLAADPAAKTLTIRGTLAQAELAEWLLARLDLTPATPKPDPAHLDHRPVSGSDTLVRVLYFKNTHTPQSRNEAATVIRSLVEIPSLFLSNAAGAMVVRGTVAQADAAQWVFHAIDNPAPPPEGAAYRMPGGGDDTIRLFALPGTTTLEQLHRTATQVRSAIQIRHLFVYSPARLIAIRASNPQLTRAAAMLPQP